MVHLIKLSCKRNIVQQSVEKAILRYRRELQTTLAHMSPLNHFQYPWVASRWAAVLVWLWFACSLLLGNLTNLFHICALYENWQPWLPCDHKNNELYL